jgi:phosphoglycolate phosphatase-like HAD superfamily hydrolase
MIKTRGKKIRNILFDVDGTLLDSKRDIAAAQIWAFHQLGVDSIKPEDIFPLIGKPLTETFSTLLPKHLHERIPEAGLIYRDYYRAHAFDTTTLFPGVQETVASLHKAGVNLATATIKSTETTAKVLAHFGIAKYFAHIQGTDNTPAKPDPHIIYTILEKQDWKKDETMMVGDTDKDVFVGRNAGVRTCGVTYGSFTRNQMLALKPDWVIDRISELLEIT